MHVSVLYIPGCPNWQEAGERLRLALDDLGRDGCPVDFLRVESDADATEVGFRGSPTITVDGVDLFPEGAVPIGRACRLYLTSHGLAGVPDLVDITTALRERTDG